MHLFCSLYFSSDYLTRETRDISVTRPRRSQRRWLEVTDPSVYLHAGEVVGLSVQAIVEAAPFAVGGAEVVVLSAQLKTLPSRGRMMAHS